LVSVSLVVEMVHNSEKDFDRYFLWFEEEFCQTLIKIKVVILLGTEKNIYGVWN
jgi:hypothetical protein